MFTLNIPADPEKEQKRMMILERKQLGVGYVDMALLMGVDAEYIERWENDEHTEDIPNFQLYYGHAVRLLTMTVANRNLMQLANTVMRVAVGRGWIFARQNVAWVQAIVDSLERAGMFKSIDINHPPEDGKTNEDYLN